jgi:integrase
MRTSRRRKSREIYIRRGADWENVFCGQSQRLIKFRVDSRRLWPSALHLLGCRDKIFQVKEKRKSRARYGDGSLYLRGSIWHVKYREVKRLPDGTTRYVQHRYSTRSPDREFAQKFLRRKLLEIGGRRTVVDPEKVSYEALRENFLAHCVEKKLRSLQRDKDGQPTFPTLPRLNKFFGAWRAAEVMVADLRRFRAECRQDGLSDARANRYLATLRAMFRWGLKDELISPAEMPGYFPMVAEPNVARGAIFIKPEWYTRLRKVLREPLRSAFTLAYRTSVRVEELKRLHWRDFDVKQRLVTLPAEITKTGTLRLVPLPSDFDRKPGPPDELVFSLGDHRKQWYKACVKVGAGKFEVIAKGRKRYVGPLLRHCRHTAVRNMSDAGLAQKRIMDISGHVSDAMFRRYNIGLGKDVALARDVMERFHRAQQKRLK